MTTPQPGQIWIFKNKHNLQHTWVIEFVTKQQAKAREHLFQPKFIESRKEGDDKNTLYYFIHNPEGTYNSIYYYSAREKEVERWVDLAYNKEIQIITGKSVKDVLEVIRATEKLM